MGGDAVIQRKTAGASFLPCQFIPANYSYCHTK